MPAKIDLPYAQRVLKTIYHLDGEATRRAYAKKLPDAELYERLEAIFGGQPLDEAKRVVGEGAAEGFVTFADPPGDATVRAVDLLQATATCIIVQADLDFGPFFKAHLSPQPQAIIQMVPTGVVPFNPTGWGVAFAGQPDPGQDLRSC